MSNPVPTNECDLILQGGITSGVVYPPAILELKTKYRFRGLGGASAGAIAAALTAAAEYGRMRGKEGAGAGFERLKAISDDLSSPRFITDRFQSTRETQAAFEVIKAALRAGTDAGKRKGVGRGLFVGGRIVCAFLATHLGLVVGAMGMALALVVFWAHCIGASPSEHPLTFAVVYASATLGTLLVAVGWPAYQTWKRVTRQLFGFCVGSLGPDAQADSATLTDWLYTSIQELAGLPRDEPLTFRHLREPSVKVELKMMTSNLSIGQPIVLPSKGVFLYSKVELAPYFPPEVMSYLERADQRRTLSKKNIALGPELRRINLDETLPVIVAVRMSLSFPILLSALPLRQLSNADFGRDDWSGKVLAPEQTQRHVFSDGGIAHNFPLQMFDSWVPSRPTFGIALHDSPFTDARAAQVSPSFMPLGQRVLLPQAKDTLKVRPAFKSVETIPSFAAAILDLARSYRDRYHSALPGYRERIVRVYLGPEEGGLNLSMSQPALDAIRRYGKEAGLTLLERYPTFEDPGALEHRWVRLRSLMPALEAELRLLRDYGVKMAKDGEPWWVAAERSFEHLLAESTRYPDRRMHGHLEEVDGRRLRAQLGALLTFARAVCDGGDEPIGSLNPVSTVRVGRDL